LRKSIKEINYHSLLKQLMKIVKKLMGLVQEVA